MSEKPLKINDAGRTVLIFKRPPRRMLLACTIPNDICMNSIFSSSLLIIRKQ